MNKLLHFGLSAALVITFFTGSAAHAEALKVGAVNALKVLEQSPQAEAAKKKIEKEFAPRDRKLVAEQKKLKEMEDRLGKDGAIMSESERRNLERDIISKKRDMKRSQDEFREDLNFRRNEEFSKIQKDIVTAIQEVAKEEGYDIVLGEGVIFASQAADISGKVIEKLKAKQGGGGS